MWIKMMLFASRSTYFRKGFEKNISVTAAWRSGRESAPHSDCPAGPEKHRAYPARLSLRAMPADPVHTDDNLIGCFTLIQGFYYLLQEAVAFEQATSLQR
jgi:hypothetical protein